VRRTQWPDGSAVIDEDGGDGRDYDVNHYARVLREEFAARLGGLTAADYEAVFADPEQMTLLGRS
jgi:DNA polymerase, archaea type